MPCAEWYHSAQDAGAAATGFGAQASGLNPNLIAQELGGLLRALRAEAGALGLLARVRERAGLREAELQAVQRALLGPPETPEALRPSPAAAEPAAQQAAALAELVRAGCALPRLLAVAHCFTEEHSGAQPASGDAATEEAGTGATAEQAVRAAVLAVLQESVEQLRGGGADAVHGALSALDRGVCSSLEGVAGVEATAGLGAGSGAPAAELAASLRATVWAELQGFVLGGAPEEHTGRAARDGVLRLLASLAPAGKRTLQPSRSAHTIPAANATTQPARSCKVTIEH